LEDGGRRAAGGLGDEEVNVFGHDDVADELETISISHLTENLDERVSRARRAEKRESAVTTEAEEMQMVETVDALESFGHNGDTTNPTLRTRCEGWGTRQTPDTHTPE